MAKQEEHFETPAKRGTAIKQGAKNKEPEMTDPNLIGKMSGHVEGSKAFKRYRNIEARNPVARIIGQARNIYHDSDTLMKYVKEITYFYSSEHKTSEEILQQLYEDVRVMVSSYNMARLFSGYDENHEKAKQFGVDYPTDKKYLDDMWGIAEALKYLFYITSKMKVFLSLDMLHDLKLEKVELRNPVQRVVFTKRQEEELKEHGLSAFQKFRKRGESIKKETIIRTVHDAAILDYKGEGYLKTVPEPTETNGGVSAESARYARGAQLPTQQTQAFPSAPVPRKAT